MERTLETVTTNNALEVVRLKGELKFKHPLGYTRPSGYCFKHPVKGFYMPCGGKKALLSIIHSGGFLNFDNVVWLQPLN